MSENMSILTAGITALSVVATLISSFIVSYAVRFILGQRKKEFAAYELLGMEIGSIQKLFLIENTVIGTAAFLSGISLGTVLAGILTQLVKIYLMCRIPIMLLFRNRLWYSPFYFSY